RHGADAGSGGLANSSAPGRPPTGDDGHGVRPVNVPNIISLCWLLCVPVTVFLILNGMMLPAFWLFVAAGVSDAVDGYLAKRLGQTSTLGSYLDPIADKALLVCVYLTLGQAGHLPTWLVIMVVSRDLLIVGGV